MHLQKIHRIKTYGVAIALLCLTAFAFAEEITVVSFNMAGHTNTSMVQQTAEMIADAHADLVFLQEVFIKTNESAVLRKLIHLLGNDWDFVSTVAYSLKTPRTVGEETYKTGGAHQNNAMLYNKAKLALTNLAEEIGFTTFSGDYLFDKNTVQVVRCSLQNAPERACIGINVHLPYADKAHRARDLATLERLYARYKLHHAVLIAGDWNYPRKDLTKRNFDTVDGSENAYYNLQFGLKTTLSTKGIDRILFANDYDHFVYNKKLTVTAPMTRTVISAPAAAAPSIQFGSAVYTNSLDFRKLISDHVPIVIMIDL